ncbi:MAG: hypothetical protein ACOCP8_00630 [archaeon]
MIKEITDNEVKNNAYNMIRKVQNYNENNIAFTCDAMAIQLNNRLIKDLFTIYHSDNPLITLSFLISAKKRSLDFLKKRKGEDQNIKEKEFLLSKLESLKENSK